MGCTRLADFASAAIEPYSGEAEKVRVANLTNKHTLENAIGFFLDGTWTVRAGTVTVHDDVLNDTIVAFTDSEGRTVALLEKEIKGVRWPAWLDE